MTIGSEQCWLATIMFTQSPAKAPEAPSFLPDFLLVQYDRLTSDSKLAFRIDLLNTWLSP
jgi:hypothetical protein